MHTSYSWG